MSSYSYLSKESSVFLVNQKRVVCSSY